MPYAPGPNEVIISRNRSVDVPRNVRQSSRWSGYPGKLVLVGKKKNLRTYRPTAVATGYDHRVHELNSRMRSAVVIIKPVHAPDAAPDKRDVSPAVFGMGRPGQNEAQAKLVEGHYTQRFVRASRLEDGLKGEEEEGSREERKKQKGIRRSVAVTVTSFYARPPPRQAGAPSYSPSTPSNIPATPLTLLPPVTPLSFLPSTLKSSTQPRIRAARRTKWQKVDDIVHTISKNFRSLGAFLEVLFHIRDGSGKDPRTSSHEQMVTAFLQGASNVGMAQIIDLIYHHPQSRPSKSHPDSQLYFATPDMLRPGTSATRSLLFLHGLYSVTQLRASTNGRAKNIRLATWDDIGRVSIPWIAGTYKRRAPGVWYITECMAAPTMNGAVVIRVRRPHPTVQVGFACKAHVDEKRIMSRFGFSVHDSTARACLDSLTDSSLSQLRTSVAEGIANGTKYWQIVLDNVRQYCRQRDHRIGREDVLTVGTAVTAILLEDCAPGAFDLQVHLDRVMQRSRRELSIESLIDDIDWDYIHELSALHWVLVLVTFVPKLAHLRKDVSALFKSERTTKFRLRPRRSVMQAPGTNAERETETQGMMPVILDFMKQMGLDETALKNLIFMARGDGASVAAMWRIKKYLAAPPSHYKAFRNLVPPGPEIWHTRWTQLNALATNYYGPTASPDPSSLSKSATAARAKRPSNLKKVDFFPTSRSMELFFEARVLDCWRIFFQADDIIQHFEQCGTRLPDTESLWASARVLVRRYASQEAYTHALNQKLA
ncbi:hypothetical protein C8R45DRAFT_1157217 [Mycena sanguinolenta]|nr:hypothetical protein C8R45DRAFT_1157217 [Mycena sanguinolenta]